MTTLALPRPGLFAVPALRRPASARPARTETRPEDTRERRAFVAEMFTRNPEAFASETDVQGYMTLFGDRF